MSPEGPKPQDGIFDPKTHGDWGDEQDWVNAWTIPSSESGSSPLPYAEIEPIAKEGEG